jgi:hypothetical protein
VEEMPLLCPSLVSRIGPGRYTTRITSAFNISDAPNGGYLMYIAAQAMKQEASCTEKSKAHQHALAISTNYHLKTTFDAEAEVHVEVLGGSRSTTSMLARLVQDSKACATIMATFGDLGAFRGPTVDDDGASGAPALPAPADCVRANDRYAALIGDDIRIAQQVEYLTAADSPFTLHTMAGEPGGPMHYDAWGGFTDRGLVDVCHLPFFCDAFPPPLLNHSPTSWLPTIEISVHTRAIPPEGTNRVRVHFSSRHLTNGLFETDGEVWDEAGASLLATSRQLARVLQPPAPKS